MLRFTPIMIAIIFAAGSASASCYRDVVEFSEGICAEFVGLSGEVAAEKYSGNLGASLEGLIEKLADLDGSVDVEVAKSRYQNVLQKDVPAALREGRECRLEVAKLFFDKICPSDQSSTTTVPALAAGWKFAVIQDADGWTNVRTGPGTNYQIVTRIYDGEKFTVRPDRSNWWQVRSTSGASGYMHVSRIRLRP